MPTVTPIYTSFVGGEFSPFLFGRTDIAQYYNACQTLENMLVRPYGLAIRTQGTLFINETKDSTKTSRLLRFVFNRADSYVIEMGDEYFRFYTGLGQVQKTLGDTDAWVTATAYYVGDFVKESSIIYYCIVDHTSGTFATDLAANKWVAQSTYELPHPYAEADLFEVQYAQLNDVIYMTHKDYPPQVLTRLGANDWTMAAFVYIGSPYLEDNTGAVTLTPSAVTGSITVTASAATFEAGHVGTFWKIGGLNGDSEQGYVKITGFTSTTVVNADVIEDLDAAVATDEWAEGAWGDVRGYPARVTFHERRLCMARTDYEPQKLWMSKSYVYDSFVVGAADDDGINVQIASDEANEIQWMSSGTSLAVGTFGGEFVIAGGTGEPLTPSNINSTRQTGWGSKAIQPKKISNFIYYVQRFGQKIRELYYFWDLDNYKSADTTILAEHITGNGIVDIAYQQNPDSILWCIRDDGKIATFTREADQELQAWSRQSTDGLYESITAIPSADQPYDEVWTIVNRTINSTTKRYLEVFLDPVTPDRQDQCWYVHSGLQYSAYQVTEDAGAGLTLSAVSGTGITVTASVASFTSDDIGMRIRAIDSDGTTVGEAEIKAYTSTTVVTADVKSTFDSTTYSGGEWGLSVDNISGLNHLEGKDVTVLGDGGLDTPDKTVTSGEITTGYNYFILNIGLPYTSVLYTLPSEAGSAIGTAQGKLKRIYQLALKVYKTMGVEVGSDADSLDQIDFRDPATLMGTPKSLFTGISPNINFRGDWDYTGQIYIKQSKPLPMNILSIIPFIKEEDK